MYSSELVKSEFDLTIGGLCNTVVRFSLDGAIGTPG